VQILLASANSSVLGRWHSLLAEGNLLQQAGTPKELKKCAATGQLDLILLHRPMIDSDLCSEIRRLAPSSRLFLLSDQPDQEEGLSFLKLGIVGYANTYISPERLAEALHVVGSDGVWLGQKVIQQLILESRPEEKEMGGHNPDPDKRLAVLSPMESRVAELVAHGQTNLEIAAELGIVERTVKAHLTAIYAKMHVGNRLSLALLINRGESR
jgi:two-component system nitrate/nitrite response regulator NarL